MSRREVIRFAAAGVFIGVAACSNGSSGSVSTVPDEDLAFALRWVGVVPPRFDEIGLQIASEQPDCIDVARARLDGISSTREMTPTLNAGCRADGVAGTVVVVDGWSLPSTLAGLVAAVALIRERSPR